MASDASLSKVSNKPGNAPIKKMGHTAGSKFGTNSSAKAVGRPTPRNESIK